MKTVLVVEDSTALREFISVILEKAGYESVMAENGKDALNKLNGHDKKIDIVLTDFNMPVMNGIEFVKEMRGTSMYISIPVILMTTELHESKKQEAKQAGVSEWINKPFTSRQLKDTIKKFIK
mgnify:CR=1 FL=1